MTRAELADFEPSDGHLHSCPYVACDTDGSEANPTCDCSALLYCIAEDQSIALHRAKVLLRQTAVAVDLDRTPGLSAAIAEFLAENP